MLSSAQFKKKTHLVWRAFAIVSHDLQQRQGARIFALAQNFQEASQVPERIGMHFVVPMLWDALLASRSRVLASPSRRHPLRIQELLDTALDDRGGVNKRPHVEHIACKADGGSAIVIPCGVAIAAAAHHQ